MLPMIDATSWNKGVNCNDMAPEFSSNPKASSWGEDCPNTYKQTLVNSTTNVGLWTYSNTPGPTTALTGSPIRDGPSTDTM